MQVKDVMSTNVFKANPANTVLDIAQIMVEKKVGSLLVCDKDTVLGIVSHEDILKVIAQKKPLTTKVQDIMTKKVISISPTASLEDAADLMVAQKIKKLPVQLQGKLIGIVTASDLLKYEENLIEKLSEIFLYQGRGPMMAG